MAAGTREHGRCAETLPENGEATTEMHRDWQHNIFVQRSYKRVHQFYKEIIKHIKEAQYE
jgi:hypothetical protein